MTEVPMFDMPRPCRRCGRPDAVTGESVDVCGYCLHLDHSTNVTSCYWCASTTIKAGGAAAGRKAAEAAADADPEFAHACQKALAVVRDRRDPFTAADVRATLEEWGVTITRPAALGSVFTRAAAAGVIRPTGNFRVSPVPGQHGRPLREWVAA